MSVRVIIQDNSPLISFRGGISVSLQPDSLGIVNFRQLKGDKGDPGSDANVDEHLDMFDHGELHEHSNKGLLDLLSLSGQDLAYNGMSIVGRVIESDDFQQALDVVNSVQTNDVHHFLFTTDYDYVSFIATHYPSLFTVLDALWTPAEPPPPPA